MIALARIAEADAAAFAEVHADRQAWSVVGHDELELRSFELGDDAQPSALLAWRDGFRRPPRRTFVVHGEESTSLAFAEAVRARPGWNVDVPEAGEAVVL